MDKRLDLIWHLLWEELNNLLGQTRPPPPPPPPAETTLEIREQNCAASWWTEEGHAGQTTKHKKPLAWLHCFPSSQISVVWFFFSLTPPARHFALQLAFPLHTVLETQRFVYDIRADYLKKPLPPATLQRPLGLHLLSLSDVLNAHMWEQAHKTCLALMQTANSGRGKNHY